MQHSSIPQLKTCSEQTSAAFCSFREELDTKHDRHERIVKLSRDVTIDSKRTIFLLHRITQGDLKILDEAEKRLQWLRSNKFRSIASELVGVDPYLHLRGFTPGLQEYIEAASFWEYLKTGQLLSLANVRQSLQFPIENGQQPLVVTVPVLDYMLGIADMTGELMRLAINYIGAGNVAAPMEICRFLSGVHSGFVAVGGVGLGRDFGMKVRVMKQSLAKVENCCYVLKLRESEVPPEHLLAHIRAYPSVERSDLDRDYNDEDVN